MKIEPKIWQAVNAIGEYSLKVGRSSFRIVRYGPWVRLSGWKEDWPTIDIDQRAFCERVADLYPRK